MAETLDGWHNAYTSCATTLAVTREHLDKALRCIQAREKAQELETAAARAHRDCDAAYRRWQDANESDDAVLQEAILQERRRLGEVAMEASRVSTAAFNEANRLRRGVEFLFARLQEPVNDTLPTR